MRIGTTVAAMAIGLLTVSGCTASGGQMTPSPSAESPSGRPPFISAEPTGSRTGTPMTPSAAQLGAISADLAKRNVTGEMLVVQAVSITWNDGSLGCPVPGRFYTQSLIPGSQIIVKVNGTSYDYRFGRGDSPTLCEHKK